MSASLRFELTAQHITLLRHACVDWDGCEFGAPAINCKRPYGNSDVVRDIAELLHPEFAALREGAQQDWLEDNAERLSGLHRETETALQIVLATGRMEPGVYQRDTAWNSRGWRRTDEAGA